MAWRLLFSCLIAALAACAGSTTAAPPSSRTPSAPVAVTSGATGATGVRPAPAPPSATRSVAAVVTGYYQAIVSRNYRKAFGYLAPAATGPDGHRLTLGSFLQLARMLDGTGGPVTRFSIGAYPSGVVMTLYRASYGPYHAHLRMVRTRHDWAIQSIDRI